MTDVSFDEEPVFVAKRSEKNPLFVRAVIKLGLAKDRKGAEIALVIFAVAIIALAIALPIVALRKPAPSPAPIGSGPPF